MHIPTLLNKRFHLPLVLAGSLGLFGTVKSNADTFSMTASDAGSGTSFATAGFWSGGLAPSSGNNYEVVSNRTLRTVTSSSGSQTFAGDRLTLGNGSAAGAAGTLAFKTPGLITIGDLVLNNGILINFGFGGAEMATLRANITLGANGGVINTNTNSTRGITIDSSSAIGGTGRLRLVTGSSAGINTINLNSTGTYTGGTLWDDASTGDTVVLGSATALGDASGTLNVADTDAVLDLGGNNIGVGRLIGLAGSVIRGGTTSGTSTLTVGNTGTGNNGTASTFGGIIEDGTGGRVLAVTKTGAGNQTLTGANIYTGTTLVSEGTLTLSGGGSIANSSTVNVQSGATLNTLAVTGGTYTYGTGQTVKGNGTIIGNTILLGTLAAGNSPGILTFDDDLAFAASTNSIFEIQDTGTVRGTDYDGVGIGGILTYGGTLTLTMTDLVASQTYNLFDFDSIDPGSNFDSVVFDGGAYSGSFSLDGDTWTASASGQIFNFSLASGNLNVSAIPEPSTTLLLAGALAALSFRRRA